MNIRELESKSKAAQEQIAQRLSLYCEYRDPRRLAGQFLDAAGARADHNGIAGVSIWIIISDHVNRENGNCCQITENCKDFLRQLIDLETDGNENDEIKKKYNLDKNKCQKFLNDARNITIKSAHLVDALFRMGIEETNFHDFLKQSSSGTDRSKWGFTLKEEHITHPIATAFVLLRLYRSGRLDLIPPANLKSAIKYVTGEASNSRSPIERLFLLNFLMRCRGGRLAFLRSRIRDELRAIFREVSDNPCAVPNPCIVDYQDPNESRSRYLRIPSDIIILEALMWLDDKDLRYLRFNAGRQMFNSFISSFFSGNEQLDSSGARWSSYSALYSLEFLTDLIFFIEKSRYTRNKMMGFATKVKFFCKGGGLAGARLFSPLAVWQAGLGATGVALIGGLYSVGAIVGLYSWIMEILRFLVILPASFFFGGVLQILRRVKE